MIYVDIVCYVRSTFALGVMLLTQEEHYMDCQNLVKINRLYFS